MVSEMAECIELTEELKLSMCAGARAILNTKKYHGTIYMQDVFSDSPKEIPYLQAAEILYTASEQEQEDVAPVVHGKWLFVDNDGYWYNECSVCGGRTENHDGSPPDFNYCPNCGAQMDLEVG